MVKALGADADCDMIILSDANTVFINEILRHHQLTGHFQRVSMQHLPVYL